MKNAEELFDEFATSTDGIIVQYKANFIEALSEHDNELISEIEKKIEECASRRKKICIEKAIFSNDPDWLCEVGYKQALTEIITLIKEK